MKRTSLILVPVLMSMSLHAQQPPAPTPVVVATPARAYFHIYLLMGQSNMVGRDTSKLATQIDNPRLLALNHDNQWVVARDPLFTDIGRIPGGQGPGIPFGLETLKTDPNISIGLVPCAVGGTPLRRWVRGGDLYEQCVTRAKLVAPVGTIEGVLWHQGEADTTTEDNAKSYETRLVQMFRDLRADLGLPGLTIVVGQLGPYLEVEKYPYVATVRTAIKHLPADLPHVGYADSESLVDKGDKLHFNADSQKIFGARYANAMQEAASSK